MPYSPIFTGKGFPEEVNEAALLLTTFFREKGNRHWKLHGVASRDSLEHYEGLVGRIEEVLEEE